MDANDMNAFDMMDYWRSGLDADRARAVTGPEAGPDAGFIVFRRSMPGDRMFDIFETAGAAFAVLNGSLFDAYAERTPAGSAGLSDLRSWIASMTGAVFEADNIFYATKATFRKPEPPAGASARLLGDSDATAFAAFDADCSADDLDAGYVELDHDIVAGAFADGRLVCKASAYPFFDDDDEGDGPVWDIGYVTRPDARLQGYGALCAGFLAAEILRRGAIPLIRAEDKRPGSIRIAMSLGFSKLGVWTTPECEE